MNELRALVDRLKYLWTCPECLNGESDECKRTVLVDRKDYECLRCSRLVKEKWFKDFDASSNSKKQ